MQSAVASAGPTASLRTMRLSPQSKRMAEPGKAAIKYLSVKACVTSLAMIAPTTGRSAEAVKAMATGEVTLGAAARESSVVLILKMKTKPDAASRTRGMRP